MPLSAPGLASNLDVNGLVSQLMNAESAPLRQLAAREATFQARLSAYGSLKGALSSFQSTMASLATPQKFNAATAVLGDSTVASASAAPGSPAGSYTIEVQGLAREHKLRSAAFAGTSSTVGSGTLTISFGTYSADTFALNPDKATRDITIAPGQDSLAAIRDAINAADAGVTAAIINDGSGYRLALSSRDSGAANALRITVADDDATDTDAAGLSQLLFDGRSVSGIKNLTQTVAAQNATLVIDGISISKASNGINDALEGVTLNLLRENTPDSTTLNIGRDTAAIQAGVQSFVKAYNDLYKTVGDLSKYDAASKRASTLTGDSAVRSVQDQVRSVLNASLASAGGGMHALSDIGVSFQKDGTLKLDSGKLTAVLNDPTRDLSTLFAAVGKPTDSLVTFFGSTTATRNGVHAVTVSRLATQGTAVAQAAAGLVVNAGANDTLDLTVDGVAASITLAAGTYSADQLAAEIQARVNGATTLANAAVSVAVRNNAGIMTMTSGKFGSASTVSIDGGNAKAGLFGTPVQTAGVDVAGTIGGSPANGNGQVLTGSGEASGLALKVAGGASGSRGSVSFGRGFAYELDKLVGTLLQNDSVLDGRVDGVNASIKAIGQRRAEMTDRLAQVEKRYRAQFAALDRMISSMNTTSSFLTQQLANLPGSGK